MLFNEIFSGPNGMGGIIFFSVVLLLYIHTDGLDMIHIDSSSNQNRINAIIVHCFQHFNQVRGKNTHQMCMQHIYSPACFSMQWWIRMPSHVISWGHCCKFFGIFTAAMRLHSRYTSKARMMSLMWMSEIPFSITYATWKVIFRTTTSQFQFGMSHSIPIENGKTKPDSCLKCIQYR